MLKDALSIISKKLGKNTIFISVPMSLSAIAAYIVKLLTLGKFDVIEKVLRMGENRAYSYDLAARDLDYSPMSFEEGISIEIKEFNRLKAKTKIF